MIINGNWGSNFWIIPLFLSTLNCFISQFTVILWTKFLRIRFLLPFQDQSSVSKTHSIKHWLQFIGLKFQIHSNWSLASLVQMNCIVVWLKGICQCVLVYLYLRVCINSICLLRCDAVNSVGNAKVWMAYANNRIHVYIKK